MCLYTLCMFLYEICIHTMIRHYFHNVFFRFFLYTNQKFLVHAKSIYNQFHISRRSVVKDLSDEHQVSNSRKQNKNTKLDIQVIRICNRRYFKVHSIESRVKFIWNIFLVLQKYLRNKVNID